MVPALLLILLGQAASVGWSNGRPRECSNPGGSAANVWERATSWDLRRYCDLIARAASKLSGAAALAEGALGAARDAERVLPGRATPRVLEGRALAALGNFEGALVALRDARARDGRSLDDPQALLAWARVLAHTGQGDDAADAYRLLLPRTLALPAAERSATQVEAGLVAMACGESRLDEAVAALRDAMRDGQDETRSTAVLALALALDRRGERDEARVLLEERAAHRDPRAVLASPHSKELLAVAVDETHALSALALEESDAAGARDEWRKVLALPHKTPWATHARAHLEALGHDRGATRTR